jgi:hypothetical protein
MSRALNNCRHVPGWIKPFLAGIKNGYNEKNAAQAAGVSTVLIQKRIEADPLFKQAYEETYATRRARPGSGAW